VLVPMRLSGRVVPLPVRQDEAATLVSALALALAACGAPWPAFVPVHDALRDAWRGVAALAGTVAFFDCDSLHSGAPPPRLLQVRPFSSTVQATRVMSG